jgi:hypothetical protein
MNAFIKSVSLLFVVFLFSACPTPLPKNCDPNPCQEDFRSVCSVVKGTAVCNCDEGYELDPALNKCFRYEYQCAADACGADVQRRSCVGDTCSSWTTYADCQDQEICLVNAKSHECRSCEKGCASGVCKECTEGACCNSDGQFKPKGTECNERTGYRCSESTCGASAQYRVVKQHCSGKGPLCDGEISNPAWVPTENCHHDDQECASDGSNFSKCNDCKENSTCVAGKCTCEYQSCLDACCVEGEACRWSDTCGIEEVKLTAPDGNENDWFGYSVSISGDVAIVGAVLEDAKGNNAGAAYIFKRGDSGWVQKQKLTATDGAKDDQFGWSVSISGDVAIVGAWGKDGGSKDPKTNAGAAYIFERDGSKWVQKEKVVADDGQANDYFGISVSISRDVAIVGAWGEDGGSKDPKTNAGAAYIFRKGNSGWVQEEKLMASDKEAGDRFGHSVSISGGLAIVGAYLEGTKGIYTGAAYIFRKESSSSGWVEEKKLTASDGKKGDRFGYSVSVSGNFAIVGAPIKGVAYIFRKESSDWVKKEKLMASDGSGKDYFGQSVSISANVAIVGAPFNDEKESRAGAAYLFKRKGSTWVEEKLMPTNGKEWDLFGSSVSISGDVAIIGAKQSNKLDRAGAAYLFKREGSTWEEEEKLMASDGGTKNYFGHSVSVNGNFSIVGAPLKGEKGSSKNTGAAYIY